MKHPLPFFVLLSLLCLPALAQVQPPRSLPTAQTIPVQRAPIQNGGTLGTLRNAPAAGGAEEGTVITSEKLTFDYKQAYALFEQNVVVDDPGIFLTCDTMEVRFDANDEIETIVAKGQVQIQQEDFAARAQIATYDVQSGDILLEVNPVVRKGQDILKGGVIRYNRFDEKLVTTGGVKMFLHKKEGSAGGLPTSAPGGRP